MENSAYRDTADRHDKAAKVTDTEALRSTTEQLPVDDVEFGSGWYHDVAIREAQEPVARQH